MAQKTLSPDGKEQVALALILLKDFKDSGRMDPEVFQMVYGLAQYLEVEKEFNDLLSKVPLFKITPLH